MAGFYCPCTGNPFFDGLFCIIAFERITSGIIFLSRNSEPKMFSFTINFNPGSLQLL